MATPLSDVNRAERRRCLEKIPQDIRNARYEEAFALAERVLDLEPTAEDLESLLSPQRGPDSRDFSPAQMYGILASLGRGSGAGPWRAQLRFCLLERLRRPQEAFAQSEKFDGLPPRYAWMRYHRGDMLLRTYGMYPQAEAELRAAFKAAPVFWKAGAVAAEAALCGGDRDGAFALMDELAAGASGRKDKMAILAWRGEMRLWCGQYAEALKDLDEAARGDSELALCWRGAAQLTLGRTEAALADLDAYLSRAPGDLEALVWRGEALRRRGAAEPALRDLNRVLDGGAPQLFASINRAILAAGAGDREALRRDVRAVPSDVRDYFEWKSGTGPAEDLPFDRAAAWLESVLAAAGGVRRNENYLYPLWLGGRP